MQVTLDDKSIEYLEQIKKLTCDDSSEHVVGTALALAAMLLNKRKEGYHILLQKRGAHKIMVQLTLADLPPADDEMTLDQ